VHAFDTSGTDLLHSISTFSRTLFTVELMISKAKSG
jgi:hypothetical protein